MARPLSEEKREAILAAAAELIATSGTGASTASIAKAAGVAEGTLFTYFATKDDLLNQLFVEIETDLAQTMMSAYPAKDGSREHIWNIWDRLIDWGTANSTWHHQVGNTNTNASAASRRSAWGWTADMSNGER